MRVLFTFAGGIGHFIPLLPIARAMAAEGHHVTFGAQPALHSNVQNAGFKAFDTAGKTIHDDTMRSPLLKLDWEREYQAIREGYARRIARPRAHAILSHAARWKPDLLVCDEMDFGCMVAAERLHIPYATMLVIASGLLARNDLLVEPLNDLCIEHNLPPDPNLTMLSRFLVLSPFPASFRDPGNPLPSTAHAFRAAAPVAETPPAWLSNLPDRPTIYITLGTVFNIESGDLFHRLLKGLRSLPVNLVVTVGPQINPAELGPQPDNVWIERYVDQQSLLPRCALVVSHAGSGTVSGALAHGLPMLLLPIGADQPFNAQRAQALGVAQVLDPTEATPDTMRRHVVALLASADHRRAAERIRDEIALLPGQETAVALLNKLAEERTPHSTNQMTTARRQLTAQSKAE